MRTNRRSTTARSTAARSTAAAAPLLAAALVLTGCTGTPEAGRTPDDGTASATSPGTASATPSDEPDDAATGSAEPSTEPGTSAEPSAEPETEPTKTGATAPMPDGGSDGQSGGDGSEVIPPVAQDGSPANGLGNATGPAAGRLGGGQRTGSAAGLVAGFPDDVVLVPKGADVESSSVTGADGRYQVTLDATVDAACTDVLLDYRSWFTSGGFAEKDTTNRPRRTVVDLTRKGDSVVLTTVRAGDGCAVTVFATLTAR
ncbi:hypothetical protein ACFWEJ_14700 [Promicromonospora sp. NPDC060204]|uniref:hypothetical protein n=1 Tax=Promicromonospora sp. NPDC060204 TaxID=3347071 RepID=UPI003651ED4D